MRNAGHLLTNLLKGGVFAVLLCTVGCQSAKLHQTTGIKICEVTSNSAIIWTRLCESAKRVSRPGSLPKVTYITKKDGEKVPWPVQKPVVTFPDGLDVDTLDGAAPGKAGEVQVWYRPVSSMKWQKTAWQPVVISADFTRQLVLKSLEPGMEYALEVHCRESDSKKEGEVVKGSFATAPPAGVQAPVSFVVTTGQRYPNMDVPGKGFRSYAAMLTLKPSFFVHTGDILYYDKYAKTIPLAHWHWQRTYSLPTNVEFHRQVASYFMKDDHDTLINDCWPGCPWNKRMGEFSFNDGLRIFKEQVGMGEKTYRTIRWGKDLQIWLVEGRDFRSSNKAPDGPEKTIWGKEQMAWFKKTVKESDATFRVLISPTPIVGPDRKNKKDNHANPSFATEGNALRAFLASQKNMYVVCGDRHWQYVSKDTKTGLVEFSCGPLSNKHAGGWSQKNKLPQHMYLNVVGGFLYGGVKYLSGKPILVMRHYSPEGAMLHEHFCELK